MTKLFNTYMVILIVSFFFVSDGIGQKVIKTESGNEVVILQDGTWRYKNKDGYLSDTNSQKENQTSDKEASDSNDAKQQSIELERLRYETFEIEANAAVQLTLVQDYIELTKEKSKKADKPKQKELDKDLSTLKQQEKSLEKQQKLSDHLVKEVNKIYQSKKLSTGEKISRMKSSIGQYTYQINQLDKSSKSKSKPNVLQVNSDDVIGNPPQATCNFHFDGIDEYSGMKRKELSASPLFSYTHKRLEDNFKDKDFIECNAFLTTMGGYTYLTLEIRMASENANNTYGGISQGNILNLHLINGEKVTSNSMGHSQGMVDKATRSTFYRIVYTLDKSDLKNLRKNELDKIGIMWISGYEEYEVYEMDIIINQLKCLEN